MRGRTRAPSGLSYSFGPGGITRRIKMLIAANVAGSWSWVVPEVSAWLACVRLTHW